MQHKVDDPRVAAALARNDRYLAEFVESLNLCPFAKRCREDGKLHRAVLLVEGDLPGTAGFDAAAGALAEAIRRFELMSPESIEVGLVLLPALAPALAHEVEGARAFEQLVRETRERTEARHARGEAPFHCVAFHPHFREDLTDAHRAVRFIRRSPDPTVQLVRASVLQPLRRNGSISERIAEENFRTLNETGTKRLSGLLAEFGAYARPRGE